MKILIVTSADETIGGVPYIIGNLARQLKGRGHDIIFLHLGNTLCLTSKTTKWGFAGFALNLQMPFGDRNLIVSLLLFAFRFPIGLFQLIRLVRKHRIEVVNIHYPAECFVYFAVCRRILPITLVTSVHGADLFPDGKPKASYPRGIKMLLHASDRIVAPSHAYGENVAGLFPQLREKIVCIHNGVDLNELQQLSGSSVNWPRVRYILCVAMHNEKKGIDVLLRAFAQIQAGRPELRLVLAGDGPLRRRLEDLAESLGIAKKVDFLGRQRRSQVAILLVGCEVFVLPSRSEPFGIALIEAMACKKPIVSTRVGGIPEIIESGKNGILVEPDNPNALAKAINVVLRNRELRHSIAHEGYVTVHKRFRSEHTGSAYESVFAALLDSASRMRRGATLSSAGQL